MHQDASEIKASDGWCDSAATVLEGGWTKKGAGASQMAGADPDQSADAALLALFDVLGRRWALRVVWELRASGLTYRDLAARVPGMSTSVLTQRLRDLRTARLIEHERGSGYQLTPDGHALLEHLTNLRNWAEEINFSAEPPVS